MVSIFAPGLILVTALLQGLYADDDGSGEKIIIHVPYKIHNHLHTHTNYKVIKVPESGVEKPQEETAKEEEMKYLDKELESILSGSKLPNLIKHSESEFKPQTFPVLNVEPSSIPVHPYHDVKEVEHFHRTPEESVPEHIISLPSRIPTLSPTLHTTIPDNKYGEGKLYFHTFSTKSVPFYNAQIVNPTYQVEEKEVMPERIHHQIPHEAFIKPKATPKSSKDPIQREYISKHSYSIRPSKFISTAKAIKIPNTTKMFMVPTKMTKTYIKPTTKSFVVSSTKKPKKLIKNKETYEHIGYLVVGENSQKFVGVTPKPK